MSSLSYDRYCAELVAQTDLLRAGIEGADPAAPVPARPGWDVGHLLRHLGGGHRWAEEIVRTGATEPPSDDRFRELSGHTDQDPVALGAWLAEGAMQLADTLRAAGPDTPVWTPVPGGEQSSACLARRCTHETLIHRADATLAIGATFAADTEVVVDAFDERMELEALPQVIETHPEKRELLGPGRTLHFHATDTAKEAAAEWLIDLTGETVVWRRAHEKAAVAVRGPLADLLLIIYRRQPPSGADIEVFGDGQLLDFWLERVGFGDRWGIGSGDGQS